MKAMRFTLAIVAVQIAGLALIGCGPTQAETPPTSSNTDGVERPIGSDQLDSKLAIEDGN